MTLLPVFDDVQKLKEQNLAAELQNVQESEQTKIEQLEEELKRVKENEQAKIARLEDELRRIRVAEKRRMDNMEEEMLKMQEDLDIFRVLATRRMEDLERLIQEDVGNMEEEVWKSMDVTRKANIDLAAIFADEKQATDDRLRQLDDNQREHTTKEKQLHSSVARCEFELSNLTAKVQTLEQSCYLQSDNGGERASCANVKEHMEKEVCDGEPKPFSGGEVHQLKDAIISVLKGVDTTYAPRKGVSAGGVLSDNSPIKLTINMKMVPKADT